MGDPEVKGKVAFLFTSNGTASQVESQQQTFQPKKLPQCVATFVSTLGSFGLGSALAWTSPALPDMIKRQYFGDLSLTQTSWITSLAILGALISGPVSGYLINRFGRRKTMILMALPFTLGWFCIGFAKNVTMIHIGRFITGFAGGSFTVTIPVYVSEIAENQLRGMLGSAMVLMLVSGILFAYTVGAFVAWWQLALICSTAPLLCFIGLFFIPESPRFLLTKGNWSETVKALQWFRGATNSEQIDAEMSILKYSIDSDQKSSSSLQTSSWKCLLQLSVLKPLAVTLTLMFFQQISGINAIQSYTVKIFESASQHINPNMATIIIGIVQVVFVFLSMMLVDKVGRKVLLVLSYSIMAVSLLSLGTFFYLRKVTEISNGLDWIPLVAVIFFVIAYSFGVGPLPWVLFGEIISPNAKGFASAVVTSFYWIIAFISTKTFENLAEFMGWHGYYWHLAIISVCGGVFTIFMIPETKGKTQEEIQQYFCKTQNVVENETGECEQFHLKLSTVDIDNNLSSSSEHLS